MSFLKRYLNVFVQSCTVSYSSMELQPSFVETSTSRYSLESYGLVHPLQVREVLKTSRDYSEYVNVISCGQTALSFLPFQMRNFNMKQFGDKYISTLIGYAFP